MISIEEVKSWFSLNTKGKKILKNVLKFLAAKRPSLKLKTQL